jgi:hypothetical protein
MTTFDKREEAFEAMFVHDEELRFRAIARRNKLLGQWAASLMDLQGADANTYSGSLIAPDFLGTNDDRLILKIVADLKAKGVERSAEAVAEKSTDLLTKAAAQIKAGG